MRDVTVDIIVPVYNGLDYLRRALASVLAARVSTPYRLLIINDASPDPEVAEYLQALAKQGGDVEVLTNEQNLGFVGTVNRGMVQDIHRDVVLLNSDTMVANDWLDRLRSCATESNRVASVTPFSNNATICSFPRFCADNKLPVGWSLEMVDACFAKVNRGIEYEVPTGVGFCLYITRAALDDIGLFDEETFGRGYGEENDFCMRASERGWRNLHCASVFVYHAGGVSFGMENNERAQSAQAILDRLYPNYHRLVQEYIARDPAEPARLHALTELYRRSPKRKLAMITHGRGGGTDKHVEELCGHLGDELDPLIIHPGKADTSEVRVSLGAYSGAPELKFRLPEEYPRLVALCRYIGIEGVHIHHTMGVETSLRGLAENLGVPFDLTVHDYYLFNANPTQTTSEGRYDPDPARQDPECTIPGELPLERWRENQRSLLRGAYRVFVPSHCAAELFRNVFPNIELIVVPHPDWHRDFPYPPTRIPPLKPRQPLVVAVLGALSQSKGADILEQTAKLSHRLRMAIEFHLVGYAYRPLDSAVRQHGAYTEQQLDELIAGIAPHLIWFPALWPETYSYTLSEALRVGVPVVVPNIGAFPERVRGRPMTWVLPWNTEPKGWVDHFDAIADQLGKVESVDLSLVWENQRELLQEYRFEYRRDYLTMPRREPLPTESIDKDWLAKHRPAQGKAALGQRLWRKRLLLTLARLRRSRVGAWAGQVVPFEMQRAIKRRLS